MWVTGSFAACRGKSIRASPTSSPQPTRPYDLGSRAWGRLARPVPRRAALEANRQVPEASRRDFAVQPGADRMAPFPRADTGAIREHSQVCGDAWELRTTDAESRLHGLQAGQQGGAGRSR